MRILLLELDIPWVTSLFMAMPESVTVDFIGVHNLRERRFKPQYSLLGMFRIKRLGSGRTERYLWTLSRLRRLTRFWLFCYRMVIFSGSSRPDVVVATDPGKLKLLGAFRGIPTVYYAHDVFEYYSHWNREQVRRDERRLLETCTVVAAVARKLKEDFEARVPREVLYLPMATESRWLRDKPGARPGDLPTGRPIVGCTGNVNGTFDWDFIEAVAKAREDFYFVFVGPNIEGDAAMKQRIARVLSLPNVRWLGPRPHELLRDYMAAFDVCLCPLKPGDHSDRRSPLRLFDYLTTDRPVISTDIAEAYEHEGQVLVASDVDECMDYLAKIKSGEYVPVLPARRKYMEKQTWEARAQTLLDYIESQGKAGRGLAATDAKTALLEAN